MTTDPQLSVRSPLSSEGRRGTLAGGLLDGRLILRFAHAFKSGGGVERYLEDLDNALLRRNAVTIVRFFIGGVGEMTRSTEKIGRGVLIKIPLPLRPSAIMAQSDGAETDKVRGKHLFRNRILYNPIVWWLCQSYFLKHWRIKRREGEVVGAGPAAQTLVLEQKVDLAVLHFFGGADAEEVVQEMIKAQIPYVVLNHFSNDRFLSLSMRRHSYFASGTASVSDLKVPHFLRKTLVNLSDGIDTDFFDPSKGIVPPNNFKHPLILLPARIVRVKGHLDLIKAVELLSHEGLRVEIGFAGRAPSQEFDSELRAMAHKCGIADRVHFLGEQSLHGLRNWYKAATILAFPTYHHEGLPRITIEAQSMQLPVVAYATGGTSQSIIEGETGYLLKTGDVVGMVGRLSQLLTNPDLRQTMGKAGRIFAQNKFSLEALAERHEEFYCDVLNRSPEKEPARNKLPANHSPS